MYVNRKMNSLEYIKIRLRSRSVPNGSGLFQQFRLHKSSRRVVTQHGFFNLYWSLQYVFRASESRVGLTNPRSAQSPTERVLCSAKLQCVTHVCTKWKASAESPFRIFKSSNHTSPFFLWALTGRLKGAFIVLKGIYMRFLRELSVLLFSLSISSKINLALPSPTPFLFVFLFPPCHVT